MDRLAFDPARIRWIALDAVGTLIRPEPSAAAAYHRVGAAFGSRLDLPEVTRRFREAFVRTESDWLPDCGCRQADQLHHTCERRESLRWRAIVETVFDDVDSKDGPFCELFEHFGRPSAWRCFPDVRPALDRLQQAGLGLAIASNFDARLHSVVDGLPDLKAVQLRIVSSQIGYRKPSQSFFRGLMEAAGCRFDQLVFVGDHPQNDVVAAGALGIAALHIDRTRIGGDNNPLDALRPISSLTEIVDRLRL